MMEINAWTILGTVLLLIHLFLAYSATFDVLNYPLFGKTKRVLWFFFLWLVPIFGLILLNKRLGLRGGILNNDGDNMAIYADTPSRITNDSTDTSGYE